MAQPSGQVLVDSGHSLAGTLFAYANDTGLWDATSGAMLSKTGTGAVVNEGVANVATSNADTYYTLASTITLSGAFSVGFRCRQTTSDSRSMVLGQHTTTSSYIWLNNSGSSRFTGVSIGTNGGTTSMTTWHIVRDGTFQPIRLYKNGVLQATQAASGGGALTISAILKGYSTNTSYDFAGALEWVHVFESGRVLTQGEIDSLVADPYQILQASGLSITSPLVDSGATAYSPVVSQAAGPQTVSPTLVDSSATAYAPIVSLSGSGSIAITSPVPYRMHQRNVSTDTASVTISGTYTGSPPSIQYRFDGGAWQTLVASPAGGVFSQAVTLPTGQGSIDVRFGNDTGVTASSALVGIGDIYIVAGQSNNVGVSPEVVAPVASAFTAVQYDRVDVWKPLQEGDAQATSFDGGSTGSKGSYFGALSNRLQANGVPVAFVPAAQGSTRISDWTRNTSNPASTATLYGRALTQRNEIGGCRALIWWQGESDANNATDPATFQSATNTLIDGWMTDTGTPTFLVKITDFHVNAPAIRAAQDAIAVGNANVIGIADGGGAYTGDVHYLTAAQINAVADAIYPEFVSAFYSLRAQLTLTTNGTTPAASLTGIRWAWWDAAPPNLAAAPVDSGTGATTDASGVFSVELPNTTLASGDTGTLLAIINDGTAGSTANKAFCAPVEVT